MRKANILCKSLTTVESLGAVNFIASDKTGTLTLNKMTVVNLTAGITAFSAAEARDETGRNGASGGIIRVAAAVAGLCNDATFQSFGADEPIENRKVNGDATGTYLVIFISKLCLSMLCR